MKPVTPKFLKSDYAALKALVTKYQVDVAAIEAQVGFSTSQSSETWHDNILHEELMRKYYVVQSNLDRYRLLLRHAEVVPASRSSKIAGLGSIVTVETEDGEIQDIELGSHMTFGELPDRVSYVSPVGQLLYGAKPGQIVRGNISGRDRELRVQAIRPAPGQT